MFQFSDIEFNFFYWSSKLGRHLYNYLNIYNNKNASRDFPAARQFRF